jgi:hypothetical protein
MRRLLNATTDSQRLPFGKQQHTALDVAATTTLHRPFSSFWCQLSGGIAVLSIHQERIITGAASQAERP